MAANSDGHKDGRRVARDAAAAAVAHLKNVVFAQRSYSQARFFIFFLSRICSGPRLRRPRPRLLASTCTRNQWTPPKITRSLDVGSLLLLVFARAMLPMMDALRMNSITWSSLAGTLRSQKQFISQTHLAGDRASGCLCFCSMQAHVRARTHTYTPVQQLKVCCTTRPLVARNHIMSIHARDNRWRMQPMYPRIDDKPATGHRLASQRDISVQLIAIIEAALSARQYPPTSSNRSPNVCVCVCARAAYLTRASPSCPYAANWQASNDLVSVFVISITL